MTATSVGQLVELIERLLAHQQLHLWDISHSDENLRQHFTELKLQTMDIRSVAKLGLGQQITDSAQTNCARDMDERHRQILNLIETTALIHSIKFYELIESRIELKNQIEELKEHHRLIEMGIKCETDNGNSDSGVIDVTPEDHTNRTSVKPKQSKSRAKSKMDVPPRKPPKKLRTRRRFESGDVLASTAEPSNHDPTPTKTVHATKPEFKCHECNKILLSKNGLRTHMLIHNGTKSFECMTCKQLFYTTTRLKNHMNHVHLKLDNKSEYECKSCGQMFASQYFLKAHSFEHTLSGETLECDVCKKVYTTPVLLRKHMQHMHTHNDDQNVTCEICQKMMPVRRLKPHMYYVHTQVKSYKCELCERSFKKRFNLTKHQYTHTDRRPLQCEFCGKGFISRNVLMTHQRTHTGEKPYSCQCCERTFSSLAYVKSHMKNVHKDVRDN